VACSDICRTHSTLWYMPLALPSLLSRSDDRLSATQAKSPRLAAWMNFGIEVPRAVLPE